MSSPIGINPLQRALAWLVPSADYARMVKVGLAPVYVGFVSASIASGALNNLGSHDMIAVIVSMGMIVFSGGGCIVTASQLEGTPRAIAARLVVIYGILLALSLVACAWNEQLVAVFPPDHLVLAGAVVLIGVALTDVLSALDDLILRETAHLGGTRSHHVTTLHTLLSRGVRLSKVLGDPVKVFAVAGVFSLASRGLPAGFFEIAMPITLAITFGCVITLAAAMAATRIRERLDPLWIRFGGGLCILSVGISLLGPAIPGRMVIAGIELPFSLAVNLCVLLGAPLIGPRCVRFMRRPAGSRIDPMLAGQRVSSGSVTPLDAVPSR